MSRKGPHSDALALRRVVCGAAAFRENYRWFADILSPCEFRGAYVDKPLEAGARVRRLVHVGRYGLLRKSSR